VIVRRPRESGYARPGYIVVTETGAALDSAGLAKFMAHELAHSWFSKADPWGEDYWLTESPAEYLALRYVEASLGAEARERLVAPKRALAERAGPILGRGRPGENALYAKGPLLLMELELAITRDALDLVLRHAAAAETPTTAGFLATLEEVAGPEAVRAFERKLREE
jgi:hypothetical protein